MTKRDVLGDLPTEFRGCQWDAGWEFGGPAVVYYPGRYRLLAGSEFVTVDSLINRICARIARGHPAHDGCLSLCEYGPRFDRRRRATHVVIRVRWYQDERTPLWFEQISRRETWGPPNDKYKRSKCFRTVSRFRIAAKENNRENNI